MSQDTCARCPETSQPEPPGESNPRPIHVFDHRSTVRQSTLRCCGSRTYGIIRPLADDTIRANPRAFLSGKWRPEPERKLPAKRRKAPAAAGTAPGHGRTAKEFDSMSMTPENAATWRALADQLTQEQVANLERCERDLTPWTPSGLLSMARQLATENSLAIT